MPASTSFGAISGRVLAAGGAPVAGATVAVVGGTQPHRDIAAISGADGAFHFGHVAPGSYRVEARAHGKVGAADVVVGAGGPARVEIHLP
ncbi:MAG TPA: carboxypeptidase-like regulatory domain-containing protein [Usitatibacter sp.]|nr:carboxypeptidase-like regulatory domain-containing protein [Usitatibacter sp.]